MSETVISTEDTKKSKFLPSKSSQANRRDNEQINTHKQAIYKEIGNNQQKESTRIKRDGKAQCLAYGRHFLLLD